MEFMAFDASQDVEQSHQRGGGIDMTRQLAMQRSRMGAGEHFEIGTIVGLFPVPHQEKRHDRQDHAYAQYHPWQEPASTSIDRGRGHLPMLYCDHLVASIISRARRCIPYQQV